MMRSHERIEELIAFRSIHGVDPDATAELDRPPALAGRSARVPPLGPVDEATYGP